MKRDNVETKRAKMAQAKVTIMGWASGEFTSEDAASMLGISRDRAAKYLKDLRDRKLLDAEFRNHRYYHRVSEGRHVIENVMSRPLVVGEHNAIPLGRYFPCAG